MAAASVTIRFCVALRACEVFQYAGFDPDCHRYYSLGTVSTVTRKATGDTPFRPISIAKCIVRFACTNECRRDESTSAYFDNFRSDRICLLYFFPFVYCTSRSVCRAEQVAEMPTRLSAWSCSANSGIGTRLHINKRFSQHRVPRSICRTRYGHHTIVRSLFFNRYIDSDIVISYKLEDSMARCGTALGQDFIHAGGRNVTINLQSRAGRGNTSVITNVLLFSSSFTVFIHPLFFITYCLSLTAIHQ